MTANTKLSIIIPAYNEAATIRELLLRVRSVELPGMVREIILIDDGSTDETPELISEEKKTGDIRIITHPANLGKGAAVRTGLRAAEGDIIIIQDADLEYDPDDYPKLLAPILAARTDVVYGTRFGEGRPKSMSLLSFAANKFLAGTTNLLYRSRISDMETCYKVFRRDVVGEMKLECKRFDFEPEITAKILKRGLGITEIPISYAGRCVKRGKKISWRDGIAAIRVLVKYRVAD